MRCQQLHTEARWSVAEWEDHVKALSGEEAHTQDDAEDSVQMFWDKLAPKDQNCDPNLFT